MKQVGWFGLQLSIVGVVVYAVWEDGGVARGELGVAIFVGMLLALMATCVATAAIWFWQWLRGTSAPPAIDGQGRGIVPHRLGFPASAMQPQGNQSPRQTEEMAAPDLGGRQGLEHRPCSGIGEQRR